MILLRRKSARSLGTIIAPDDEVAATVKAAAEALMGLGIHVEQVGIPALERDFVDKAR